MQASPPNECTIRACVTGALIGVILCAGNVYTGLKIAFIDGGAITAALLAHAILRQVDRRGTFTAQENNVAQATATSAAVMGGVAGLLGPIPALAMLGIDISSTVLFFWAVSIGVCGSVVAVAMRHRWIDDARLAFPSGAATARVIKTAFAAAGQTSSRLWIILGTASLTMLLTQLRDGMQLVPAAILAPAMVGGVSMMTSSLGVALSPLMVSTGCLIGPRGAVAIGLGSVAAWYGLTPWLASESLIATTSYVDAMTWLVWPGATLMIVGALAGLLFDWRLGVRAVRDMASQAAGQERGTQDATAPGAPRYVAAALVGLWIGGVTLVLVLLISVFSFGLVDALLVCALAVILVIVCGRAVGETDMGPVGAVSAMAQAGFAGSGPSFALGASAAPVGMATSASQLLWSFKAGRLLDAKPRGVLWAHLVGIVTGAVTAIATYRLLSSVYELGSDAMPAPGVSSSLATARALSGAATLPEHATTAVGVAFVLALLLSALGRIRRPWASWIPSPIAMGVAFVMPASSSAAIVLGGIAVIVVPRIAPSWTEEDVLTAAAGGIAGESLMGVAIAALHAAGV